MHVTLFVPAPFNAVSGGYAYDRRMVSGLRATGHQVDVAELPGQHPLADNTARDAACVLWDQLPDGVRPVIDGLALPAFDGLDDGLAARGTVGLVHHPTALETGFKEEERKRLQGIERRLFRRLSRMIVTSAATAERLASEFGADPSRVSVVVPGTDDAPRCTGSGSATCEILTIGTLVPRKGHDVLMRALARLFDLNWRLTIVGSPERDPAYANELHRLAGDLRINQRVRFAGEATDAVLEALWQGADLFALATYFEGYGMVIAEALKRGLPVAVTSGGAAAALVTPDAGAVCEPGDHEQLSKALRRLVFSSALRKEMAEAAWQVGHALPSWGSQAQEFVHVLEGFRHD
jgi:glycosyltransferase involved in cell wall biosynthesis